jgi:hypothetical protein
MFLNRLLIILLLPETTVEQLERYRNWFREEEVLRVDESKRPGESKNLDD